MISKQLWIRAALVAALGTATGTHAQPSSQPVAAAGEELVASATVLDVDSSSRTLALQGPRGNVVVLQPGVDVPNFDQIRKGDLVTYRRESAAVVELEPLGSKAVSLAERVEQSARAGDGDKPGFVNVARTEVTAQITAVDPGERTVTFRGPRETLRTVNVRNPAVDLKQVKPGQMARIVYEEMVSVMVTGESGKG